MNLKKLLIPSTLMSMHTLSLAQNFEATGVGETQETAKKDAVENAIKCSVG